MSDKAVSDDNVSGVSGARDDADTPDPIEQGDEEVAAGHPSDPDPLVEK